jgi:hypothetical protein
MHVRSKSYCQYKLQHIIIVIIEIRSNFMKKCKLLRQQYNNKFIPSSYTARKLTPITLRSRDEQKKSLLHPISRLTICLLANGLQHHWSSDHKRIALPRQINHRATCLFDIALNNRWVKPPSASQLHASTSSVPSAGQIISTTSPIHSHPLSARQRALGDPKCRHSKPTKNPSIKNSLFSVCEEGHRTSDR